ncbi:MAG TPA: phosphotransferase [Patescibacteria group bacterium]|nr:phosphotransferase [Patescibacteria group bacterium]
MVKIHNLNLNPPFVFDSWAIPQIHQMYQATEQYLDEQGKQLARQAIDRYDSIDVKKLEHCFVHGDIIATNTLKGSDGKIWILDFAVSNVYPKIQELAVMTSSLLADGSNSLSLKERANRVLQAYLSANGRIAGYDQTVLLDYAIAGAAMEFLGGHKAKHIDKEDVEESEHWISIGKQALEEALA